MVMELHLLRRDPARNLARFYRLELCRSLFGELLLVRQWGRIGTKGRRAEAVVRNPEEGHAALALWCKRKRARGYRIDGS